MTSSSTSARTSLPAIEPPSAALAADQDVAVEVEHRGAQDLVRGEVDPDHLQAGPVDVDEGRALARAHDLGGAELDDLPALEERHDEVGDGHLGEAQAPGEVGPAQRAAGVERLQHEGQVLPATVGRQHGAVVLETAGRSARHAG